MTYEQELIAAAKEICKMPSPKRSQSMSKVHLLASDEPLIEGTDLTAVCGQLVAKASFVMMQDTEAMTTPIYWEGLLPGCYRCLKVPLVGRRVYAVMNGQEVMTESD